MGRHLQLYRVRITHFIRHVFYSHYSSVIPLVFQTVHHFNVGLQGTTFVSMVYVYLFCPYRISHPSRIGSFFGFATSLYQGALYRWVKLIPFSVSLQLVHCRRNFAKRGPEARLYAGCFAAVMLPVGLLIFAWSSLPQVHWIGLNIGIVVCFHIAPCHRYRH